MVKLHLGEPVSHGFESRNSIFAYKGKVTYSDHPPYPRIPRSLFAPGYVSFVTLILISQSLGNLVLNIVDQFDLRIPS